MQKLVMKMDETDQYRKDLERVATTMLDGLGIIESQASGVSACWYGSAGADFGASLIRWVQATREPVSEMEILARRVHHEREEWERTVSSRHYRNAFERFVDTLWDGFDILDLKKIKFSLKDFFDLDYPPNKSEAVYFFQPGRGWTKFETKGSDWDAGIKGLGVYGNAGTEKAIWTNMPFFPLPLFAITELSGPGASAGLSRDGVSAGASALSSKLTLGGNVPFIDQFLGISIGRSAGLEFSLKWGPDNKPEVTIAGWKMGLNLFTEPVDFSPPDPNEPIIDTSFVEIVS